MRIGDASWRNIGGRAARSWLGASSDGGTTVIDALAPSEGKNDDVAFYGASHRGGGGMLVSRSTGRHR